jgi:dolichol kinase
MTRGNIIALVISYLYAFGLLGLGEVIRKWRGYSQAFTRKLVHVGAGMWVWGILALFDDWKMGLIPFATFIVLNYIFYRFTIFKAMDTEDSTPGTVYFAVSITLLYALFWRTDGSTDRAAIATGGVMAMTWGDALASIVGQHWGQRAYSAWGHQRTWEGSLAMFVSSLVAVTLTLLLLPGSSLSPNSEPIQAGAALLYAGLASLVATLAEGVSPAGTDNLSVPLLTAATLYLLLGIPQQVNG